MSNHSGSYMLNEVITILKREHCFDHLDQEERQNLIEEIVKLARYEDDCNPGEILEGHTDYFQICSCCLAKTNDLESGLCVKCR
ncbi:hypothetical protein PN471_16390 [Aphanizomenon sp. CS-733/32]|uniref:hypothetical protein n=1 Tax=Aphanizomenon sp. CS-733/32 TaxID=3021715 RepID=UPI00232E7210|nr:hypothetical protein [Aphanizomenon sp. CS-733/32]MDB9310183.1 hypothetical protein [Aphanizomenon sp. CS-733/32]